MKNMKSFSFTMLLLLLLAGTNLSAQNHNYSEGHGRTFNLGVGVGGYAGYYGYVGHSLPVISLNYEFDAAKNFTLAPFINFYTYEEQYYRETVIPIGVKGTYYFDQILGAGQKWDFYLAGSLGFALANTVWDDGYSEDTSYQHGNPVFLDLHIGAEYHLSQKVGLFFDLSSGVSTVGLAFH